MQEPTYISPIHGTDVNKANGWRGSYRDNGEKRVHVIRVQ